MISSIAATTRITINKIRMNFLVKGIFKTKQWMKFVWWLENNFKVAETLVILYWYNYYVSQIWNQPAFAQTAKYPTSSCVLIFPCGRYQWNKWCKKQVYSYSWKMVKLLGKHLSASLRTFFTENLPLTFHKWEWNVLETAVIMITSLKN